MIDLRASEAYNYGYTPRQWRKLEEREMERFSKGIGTKCPYCQRECTFTWQVFNNQTKHIRQECPKHGYLRFAPQRQPYLTEVNRNENKK